MNQLRRALYPVLTIVMVALVIIAPQVQKGGAWRVVSTLRRHLIASVSRRLPEPANPKAQIYPSPEEAPAEIAVQLAAAAKDHKRVLLVFGGNWCYDCHVLDATFRSKQIAPLVNENYHVVHVNVGNYDKNLDLAKKYEIPLEKGGSKFGHPRSGRNTGNEPEKGRIRIYISNRPGRRHPIPETVEAATQRFMKLQAQSSTLTFN